MRAHFPASPRALGSALVISALALALVVQAAWLVTARTVKAETFEVHLRDFEFVVPADLPEENQCSSTAIPCIEILVGDSVRFVWDEGTHSVTGDAPGLSDELAFDTGVHTAPYEATFTFTDDIIITFASAVQADIDAGMQVRIIVREGEPTPRPTETPRPTFTSTSEPTDTPTSEPSETPSATATPGESVDLFEGWTPIPAWAGPLLQNDAITTFLNEHIVPNTWTAAAQYDGEIWRQRFKNPPLPTFNTLNTLASGQQLWLFADADAQLTY